MRRADIETILTVTLITVFVWTLADSQTLRSAEVVTTVEFVPAVDDRLLRVIGGLEPSGVVRVELEGPQAAFEAVRATLRDGIVLRLERAIASGAGTVNLGLAGLFSSQAPFDGSGVRIIRVTPAEAVVEVEPVAEVEVPVRVELEAGEQAAPSSTEPSSVTVRGPATLIDRLPGSAVVRVPAAVVSGMRPYQPATIDGLAVELDPLPTSAWGLSMTPSRVSATVTLRGRTAEAVIESMPVEFSMPPDLLGLWRISVPADARQIRGVTVRGPTAAVARVTSGGVAVRALARVDAAQLELGTFEVTPEVVGLPAGVGLIDAVPTIRVQATAVGIVQPAPPPGDEG